MKKLILSILIIIIFSNCSGQKLEEKTVNIGTHSLQCISYNSGGPTIVFDTGFSEAYDSWIPILQKLAKNTSVFAYNRAGYKGSGEGPMPRDSKQVARELNLLLEKAGATGPYILVGHSLGGLNMQVFAAVYKEKVKGVLLLDPPPIGWFLGGAFPELKKIAEEQTGQFKQMEIEASNSGTTEGRDKAIYFKTLYSEHSEMTKASALEADSVKSYGDLPLTVIAATIPNPQFGKDADEFQKFWIKESEKIAGKSTRGKFVIAENSKHHIHLDREDLVLKEIAELLKK